MADRITEAPTQLHTRQIVLELGPHNKCSHLTKRLSVPGRRPDVRHPTGEGLACIEEQLPQRQRLVGRRAGDRLSPAG